MLNSMDLEIEGKKRESRQQLERELGFKKEIAAVGRLKYIYNMKRKMLKRHDCSQRKSADNLRERSHANKPSTKLISFVLYLMVQSQKKWNQEWQKGMWASGSCSVLGNWCTSLERQREMETDGRV